jgi:hypothetical protein
MKSKKVKEIASKAKKNDDYCPDKKEQEISEQLNEEQELE